jgi:hypothetical protein
LDRILYMYGDLEIGSERIALKKDVISRDVKGYLADVNADMQSLESDFTAAFQKDVLAAIDMGAAPLLKHFDAFSQAFHNVSSGMEAAEKEIAKSYALCGK